MPLQTIESQRLYRQIAEQLRSLIGAGEFAPGARLPAERDLAKQLGVSRPSVREALIALEVEGVIDVRTGSGIYVRAADALRKAAAKPRDSDQAEWGPLELMRARELVEGEVAALAARNAKRADIAAISAAMAQMRDEAGAGVIPREGDEAFHTAVAQACGNEVLRDTVHGYWQARSAPLSERLGDYFENPASWGAALVEHTAVLEAIRSHDAAGARVAMQAHLKKAYSRYSASWRRANHS
jgi:DNA-binding FadR family transcriptional regulator